IRTIQELTVSIDEQQRLIKNLKRGRQYLKSDFKVHVSKSSTIGDHCVTYAVSDKSTQEFRQLCDHKHDDICIDCANLSNTLMNIEQILKDKSEQNDLDKFRTCYEAIHAWKSHQLRSINQNSCREQIIEELAAAVFLNCDWAMKWLPTKYREPQSDFFGKRGISWHISVVTKKHNINAVDQEGQKSDGETGDTLDDNTADGISNNFSQYQHKVFVHVFDQCTQDAKTVRAIIQNVLQKIKVTDPH
ncbi:unnamed protein product, partial [Didymodactylos carnosus]